MPPISRFRNSKSCARPRNASSGAEKLPHGLRLSRRVSLDGGDSSGVRVCISSRPLRRTRISIGRSPLLRTKSPIHPAVSVRGTASLLNVRRRSPERIPAAAAGELPATESTVAWVQLTESASCARKRNFRGRLSTVPADKPISACTRFSQSRWLAARMRNATSLSRPR